MLAMRSREEGGIARIALGMTVVDVGGEGLREDTGAISSFAAWLERRFCFRDRARDCGCV
jgi:hypothetical protein